MARIRTVKIGFFRDEDLCAFEPFHRLLFQGLWLVSDREGRLKDKPRTIHADIFPFDPDLDVNAMLTDLATTRDPFILRYVVVEPLIQVLKFGKHQRPNKHEPPSELPPPPNAHACICMAQGEGNGKEGNGKEGDRATVVAVPEMLKDLWNAGCGELPRCLELSPARRKAINARLKDRPLQEWVAVVARIRDSPFCTGQNDRGWKATFDWLIKPDTATKVLEGKYDSARGHQPRPKSLGPDYSRAMDWFEECKTLHQGRCENSQHHALQLAKAAAS